MIPALVQPRRELRLEQWVRGERAWLRRALREHGALLFRGFEMADAERFAEFLRGADLPLMDYPRGTSPRTEVGEHIYTSTETRPDVAIPMHTEMSYTSVFPQGVAFCCVTPPARQGATPLADMRGVLGRLGPERVAEFGRRGLRYVQIVPREPTPVLERTWPGMFGTTDRAEVERRCKQQDIECRWLADGSLRIANACLALRPHPATGEPVWFNQAHVFHLRIFEYQARQGVADAAQQAERFRKLLGLPADASVEPMQCTWGDGAEIPDAVMEEVRAALDAETVRFDWERGDLLLLDNFRVGHGREPFVGERRLLAALIARLW
jgi:alpha-ketoglutarate-dependent taurine dioxygenase